MRSAVAGVLLCACAGGRPREVVQHAPPPPRSIASTSSSAVPVAVETQGPTVSTRSPLAVAECNRLIAAANEQENFSRRYVRAIGEFVSVARAISAAPRAQDVATINAELPRLAVNEQQSTGVVTEINRYCESVE